MSGNRGTRSAEHEHLWLRDVRRHPEGEVRLYVGNRLVSGTPAAQVTASVRAMSARPESSRVSPPPDRPHDCRQALPWSSGGYGSTGLAEGTVALCSGCGRAWICLPCYQSLGPTTHWRPVRWFTRREARRRAAALRTPPEETSRP